MLYTPSFTVTLALGSTTTTNPEPPVPPVSGPLQYPKFTEPPPPPVLAVPDTAF